MILITILNTILVYLIYIIIFIALFGFSWGFTRNYFLKFKIYYQLILGAIFGVLAVIGQGLIHTLSPIISANSVVVYLPSTICSIVTIFISPVSWFTYTLIAFLGVFLEPFQLPNYFFQVNNPSTITTLVLIFLCNLIVSIMGYYFRWKIWTQWSLIYLFAFVLASFSNLIYYWNNLWSTESLIAEMNILIWIVMGYLVYAVCWLIEIIYQHAMKLQNIISYDHGSYLREALAHRTIYSIINQNRFTRGVYITFSIQNIDELDKVMNSRLKEKIIELITNQIVNQFRSEKAIFFKANKNNFGLFIPIQNNDVLNINQLAIANFRSQRGSNDVLTKYEEKLHSIVTNFKFRNYKISTKLQAVVSFYGIQSNNLDQLKKYNLLINSNLNNLNYKNILIVVDTNLLRQIELQNRKILALNQVINLDGITTLYYPIVNISVKKITWKHMLGFYPKNIIAGSNVLETEETIKTTILKNNVEIVLHRFNAINNLKKYKSTEFINGANNMPLMFIHYDSSYVGSSDFVISKFLKKIDNLILDPKQIVLMFDIKSMILDHELLLKNIQDLKKNGIKIAVKNLGDSGIDYHMLAYYIPDYGFLNKRVTKDLILYLHNTQLITELIMLSKKLKFKIIAPYVNSYLVYKKLKILGVDYMFGTLVGNDYELDSIIKDENLYLLNK